jgi:hypothetical protein
MAMRATLREKALEPRNLGFPDGFGRASYGWRVLVLERCPSCEEGLGNIMPMATARRAASSRKTLGFIVVFMISREGPPAQLAQHFRTAI